jgi:chondroitin AC lyase
MAAATGSAAAASTATAAVLISSSLLLLASSTSSSAAAVQFGTPRLVGSSDLHRPNGTHFWYPSIAIATGLAGSVAQHVTLSNDGGWGPGGPEGPCNFTFCEQVMITRDGGRSYSVVEKVRFGTSGNFNGYGDLGTHVPSPSAPPGVFRTLVACNDCRPPSTPTPAVGFAHPVFLQTWTDAAGQLQLTGNQSVRITGVPSAFLQPHFGLGSPSQSVVVLHDGTLLAAFFGGAADAPRSCPAGPGPRGAGRCFALAFFGSLDGGLTWAYRSRIDHTAAMPNRTARGWVQGPCEPSMVTLSNGTVLLMFRLQSGLPLWQSYSADGIQWSEPKETAAFSVWPQLLLMQSGALVLSTGRPSIGLWQSTNDGADWVQQADVIEQHNLHVPAEYHYLNNHSTTSYTGLVEVERGVLLLTYDKQGATQEVFAVRIAVSSPGGDTSTASAVQPLKSDDLGYDDRLLLIFDDDDLGVLRRRFVASMLPSAGSSGARLVVQAATEVAGTLSSIGNWPDVNYTTDGTRGRSWWIVGTHLQRTIVLATAAHQVPALAAKAETALRFWLHQDFTNSNWWWQWIGTPRAVAKSLLLLPAAASADLLPLALPILDRSNYQHPGNPNEATNLVWMAGTRALVGSLTDNATEVSEAYRRIQSTVAINAFDEGLQQDGSYHQHGPQLYSGWGYGAIWTAQMLFFGSMAEGTQWTFSRNASLGVSNMIVDGQRWMTAGPNFDFATCGRLMTYFANSSGPAGINHGHYHYYAAFVSWSQSFPDFQSPTLQPPRLTPLAVLFTLNTSWVKQLPNASLIDEFAAQLQQPAGGVSSAIGHRHFWKSDYSVLRRNSTSSSSSFMVSVRMVSDRTLNTECGNEEGKQGETMADGVTSAFVTGREFEDIFPVWNWRLVPGTIEVQRPNPSPLSCTDVMRDRAELQRSGFVGGVSDGHVGCSVMDYHPRGEVQLRRTWFMLDRIVIIANVGHTNGSGSADFPVTTAWDQRLVNGEATFATRTSACNSSNPQPYFTGPQLLRPDAEHRLQDLAYLHHSSVGYVPWPTPQMIVNCAAPAPRWTVVATAANRTGSWANITQGDSLSIRKPVFTAFIDHGTAATKRTDISTTYAVVPGVAAADMPSVMTELNRHLSIMPGWNSSSVCFTAAAAQHSSGSASTKSKLIGPGIDTTMMASFWAVGAASKQEQNGCWDISLTAVLSSASLEQGDTPCPGATAAQPNMHCDLSYSRGLGSVKVSNYSACSAACCANKKCDCWTWTKDEHGAGPACLIKTSSAPLQPAPGLWGGRNPMRAKNKPISAQGVVVLLSDVLGSDRSSVGVRVHVSDPTAKLASATVQLVGHWEGDCVPMSQRNASVLTVVLPTGADVGRTVSKMCTAVRQALTPMKLDDSVSKYDTSVLTDPSFCTFSNNDGDQCRQLDSQYNRSWCTGRARGQVGSSCVRSWLALAAQQVFEEATGSNSSNSSSTSTT